MTLDALGGDVGTGAVVLAALIGWRRGTRDDPQIKQTPRGSANLACLPDRDRDTGYTRLALCE